jgi:protein O-mannosyl-transferase
MLCPMDIERGKTRGCALLGDGWARPGLRQVVSCFLVGILAGLLYLNTLGHQFTNWDDGMIYQNPSIRNLTWEGIRKMFKPGQGETYQPVRMLSYAIDYKFWKLNPMGYRLTNIFFYILTCVMVFLTLRLISTHLREEASATSHFRVGLFGAVLFAAHPVHVEAVTWLAARKEVLQGCFFFLAFYLYLRARGRGGPERAILLASVLVAALLATLSKPSAVVFPVTLLVYEIALRPRGCIELLRRHWFFFVLAIALSVIFSFILIRVMLHAGGIKPYHGESFINNLLVSFYVLLYNIKLLVWTINYSAAYAIRIPFPVVNLQTFFVVGVVLLLFAFSLWSLKKTKVVFFSFLFFLVTLLPYLNIVPISTLLADRYVFIASFSFCFLLGIGFDKLYGLTGKRFSEGFFKLLGVALFLFLLGGYSFMTIEQNRVWENSYTLWSDAVEKYPQSNTANALLGVVYMDLGMNDKAAKYLEKAVQIFPVDYESRNNLGIVYQKLDRPEEALRELMTAISLQPQNDIIKINLSVFYQNQKAYRKSEEVLNDLISKNPNDVRFYYRRGLLYREMGDYHAAIQEFIRATELSPDIINPYEELGNIYASRLKDIERAKYYYQKGIESAPKAKRKVEELRWMIQDLEAYR